MLVMGLTVTGEDACIATEIQEFDGSPANRIIRDHEQKMHERRIKASIGYQKLVGPEVRHFPNLQLGAMAAYLVSRGLEDRDKQARRAHELVRNDLSAAIVNNCIELTLKTTEYLTFFSVQNRGIRLVDADSINGINDPVYDAIISSELDPVEYIAGLNEIDATIYHFPQMVDAFDHVSMGAAAGS
jgi:hypothetical protein